MEAIIRLISRNDIRERILPIPNEIFEKIKEYTKYKVEINNEIKELNINATKRTKNCRNSRFTIIYIK